ncbi:hypothetical protein [Paraburkholderia atlantica]|uniref:Uncharacterized protein n=1 Tax=Paraburkholderia atlantica TaxID=2654982 RepID=D5WK86_PARAM|nr:hypothetical protein [Paraburkholderia atlantica]ADG19632.1 hypothetical protein BC1002_5738 [Paraburkholderia atlantica]MBB5509104.1 hypothetical protein [Paraburkholderia atlantica]
MRATIAQLIGTDLSRILPGTLRTDALGMVVWGQPGQLSLALYRGWHLPSADTLDT